MELVIDGLIKNSGLKKEYIAKELGVSKDTITNWCKNRSVPRLDQAVRLAEILDCHITELYIKK